MGNSPFEYIKSKMSNIEANDFFPSGHSDWNCEYVSGFLDKKKRTLIKIPHLSRYDITTHKEVLEWIKEIKENKINRIIN